MKMWRLLFPVLLLGLVLLFEPAPAQAAKRITLQNAGGSAVWTCVVVQTYNGWRVRGWYKVAPYSYRTLNFNDAGGSAFGVYAYISNGPRWSGQGNAPVVAVVDSGMDHNVRQAPYGKNPRRVQVRMVNGNSFKFSYQGQQQQYRQAGWW